MINFREVEGNFGLWNQRVVNFPEVCGNSNYKQKSLWKLIKMWIGKANLTNENKNTILSMVEINYLVCMKIGFLRVMLDLIYVWIPIGVDICCTLWSIGIFSIRRIAYYKCISWIKWFWKTLASLRIFQKVDSVFQ